ncbi:GNAT family N-acetyltransferase [Dinoroseobacter sp. S124A]|uniref:GNAT family N-acetyltransferase n=1 Tax=Dinoroseobacter sp. S124A TaxID=3415128 RepID=UPI003C7A2CA0
MSTPPSTATVSISRATSAEDLDAVRDLVRGFYHFAMAHVAEATGRDPQTENPSVFANLDAELAGLPGKYGPPTGCLLLARLDGQPMGTVAYFAHSETDMEIKRMFVRPEGWGHGLGTQLLEALLAEARAAGYARFFLSTHQSLNHAHALYRRMGFVDRPVSAAFPGAMEGVDLCMEMREGEGHFEKDPD